MLKLRSLNNWSTGWVMGERVVYFPRSDTLFYNFGKVNYCPCTKQLTVHVLFTIASAKTAALRRKEMLPIETSGMELSLSGVCVFHFKVRMHRVQTFD